MNQCVDEHIDLEMQLKLNMYISATVDEQSPVVKSW